MKKSTEELELARIDAILKNYNANQSGIDALSHPEYFGLKKLKCTVGYVATKDGYEEIIASNKVVSQVCVDGPTIGTQVTQTGGCYNPKGADGKLGIELPEDYIPSGTAEAYFAHVTVYGHKHG